MDGNRCIAIKGGGVIFHSPDMSCTSVVFWSTIVYSSKIIIFVVDLVCRNTVGYLGTGICIEGRGISNHSPEECNVNAWELLKCILCLGLGFLRGLVLLSFGVFYCKFCQCCCLSVAHEE